MDARRRRLPASATASTSAAAIRSRDATSSAASAASGIAQKAAVAEDALDSAGMSGGEDPLEPFLDRVCRDQAEPADTPQARKGPAPTALLATDGAPGEAHDEGTEPERDHECNPGRERIEVTVSLGGERSRGMRAVRELIPQLVNRVSAGRE